MVSRMASAMIGTLGAILTFSIASSFVQDSAARAPTYEFHRYQDPIMCPDCLWVSGCLGECEGEEDCCDSGAPHGVSCEAC